MLACAVQVRMLQEQVASLEADISDMRADLAHLSAQYHSLKAAKGWYFSCPCPLLFCSLRAADLLWTVAAVSLALCLLYMQLAGVGMCACISVGVSYLCKAHAHL